MYCNHLVLCLLLLGETHIILFKSILFSHLTSKVVQKRIYSLHVLLFEIFKTAFRSIQPLLFLFRFLGDITQTVPLYSAVKVGGRRLSDLVRSGENPLAKTRRVHINSIEIQSFKPSYFPEVELVVKCCKGTYIRSLCHELALALCRQNLMFFYNSNRWSCDKTCTYRST